MTSRTVTFRGQTFTAPSRHDTHAVVVELDQVGQAIHGCKLLVVWAMGPNRAESYRMSTRGIAHVLAVS